MLEKIQRRAARWVTHRHRKTSSVQDMLETLHWPPLTERRRKARLSFGNSCYYFYNANYTRNWSDARQRCLEQDADLVTLETTQERDWVLNQVRQRQAYSHNSHTNWWTGLNAQPDSSAWAWPNSTHVNINVFNGKWATGQPRKDGAHQCVEIQSLKFSVARCTNAYQAICERPVGRPLTCAPGWTLYAGQCYCFISSAQSFNGAKGNVNNTCVEQLQNQGATKSWSFIPCNSRRQFFCQKPEGSCPNGWLQLTNRCFFIYTHDAKPFAAAQSYCSGQGASLAALDSADVIKFLYPYVHNARAAGAFTLWIGLTDNNQDNGPWKWVAGNRPLGRWHNWPNNRATNTHGKQDCITIDSNDRNLRWHPTPTCTTAHRFICQLPVNKPLSRPTTPPVHYRCPRGYVMYSPLNTCVQLVSRDMTWDQARSTCKRHSADLVTITNSAFNSFIKAQIRTHRGKYWIGLHDRHQENVFQWLDSNSRASYTDWSSGQPNRQGATANCVALFDQGLYQWYETPCGSRYHFICQTKATVNGHPPPVTTPRPWSANCGPYWEAAPNSYSCYMFNTDRLSWTDARLACQAKGGDLASITALAEEAYITGRIASLNTPFFWVGANDRQVETGWQWSDRSPFSFLDWNPGEPNNRGNSDCVGIARTDGRWSDFTCTSRYAYICEKMGRNRPRPTPALTSPASVPPGKVWGCPRGWRGFNGQCYVFSYVHRVNWKTAFSRCTQYGAAMVSIHNDAENKFVFSLLPNSYHGVTWIGLNDQSQEGSFLWTDSSAVTYTQWNNHEPNNIHNEDCVIMYRNARWTDYKCTSTNVDGFFCKKPMSLQNAQDQMLAQGCSYGIGFRAQCYAYISAIKSWSDAHTDCQRYHGNLATVNDRHIQAFVASELVYRPGAAYWIGLKNTGGQNTSYSWVTHGDVDFTSWAESHTGNEHGTCIGMATGRPVGLWTNYPCSKALPYICEVPRQGFTTPPPTPPSTTSRVQCPRGWKGFSNICIKLHVKSGGVGGVLHQAFNLTLSERLSWMESRQFCQSLSGDLLSVWGKSMENYIIATVFNNVTTDGIWWIGLNDRGSENGHVWSDGHGVAYTNWNAGEPNDYNHREDCVEWVFPKNGWNDDNCYVARNFVCSIPRGTILTTTAPPPTGVTGSMCKNNSFVYYDGTWNDNNCQDENAFICKQPVNGYVTQQTTLPPVYGNCPLGYTSLPFLPKCYKVAGLTDDTRKNFTEATTACSQMTTPGSLASLHNSIEQTYVMTLIAKLPHYSWIGLNDLKRRNYFEWYDNSEVDFTHWGAGQPDENLHSNNPDDRRDCVGMNPQPRYAGNWNDMQCSNRNHYICQVAKGDRVPFRVHQAPGQLLQATPDGSHLEQCRGHLPAGGGVLSTFSNRFQLNIVSLLRRPDSQHMSHPLDIWIGLSMHEDSKRYQWLNGWPLRFSKWGPGEPSTNGSCVKMGDQDLWSAQPCSNKYPFVCQISNGPPPTTTTVSGVCRDGSWAPHGEYCFQLTTGHSRSWPEARYACSAQGAALASIHSQKDTIFLASLFSQAVQQGADPSVNVWIGLSKGFSGGFSWADGSEVEYDNWDDGEPSDTDSGRHQDCVQADIASSKWNDVDCFDTNYYVCKMLQRVPQGPGKFTHRQPDGWNTPQPQTQTGGGSGISGGAVAGIILGTVAIIAITVVAVFFLRGRFNLQLRGPMLSNGAGGFDNALFSKEDSGGEGKASVSFGSRES
ncbi:hypothetical protein ACOMHN_042326 [Nucella lapillus]